jgi:arabinose-5-phosphate isomerase
MKPSILDIAKKTILTEAKTLENIAQNIDHDFEDVIRLLFQCKGRIIVTGIGKSALIAQKIVATLNSTGSPAIYMHASDAAHGDLGMVTKNDVLVCLSKSGQTSEIKLILPIIKSQGTRTIGICSNEESYLGKNADYCILMKLENEAEPNNLVPTSSTTAQLAIGDAIAVCLLSLRDFSKRDFASFHPGGSIGKQIFLKVSDISNKNKRPKILPSSSIRETILEMTSKRLGAAVVVDEENTILGIITDGDLRRMLQSGKDISMLQAKDIMTANPVKIEIEALAYQAFKTMHDKSISQIIVENKGKYTGIIHLHDLIDEGFI